MKIGNYVMSYSIWDIYYFTIQTMHSQENTMKNWQYVPAVEIRLKSGFLTSFVLRNCSIICYRPGSSLHYIRCPENWRNAMVNPFVCVCVLFIYLFTVVTVQEATFSIMIFEILQLLSALHTMNHCIIRDHSSIGGKY